MSHPLLPRLITKHFEPPWDSVASMIPHFRNDHDARWRRVGIACSASLLSNTEAPPYQMFERGYSLSGAPKPDCISLLVELFQQYGCRNKSLAQDIAKEIAKLGSGQFSVGGSLLQIFVLPSEAEKYHMLFQSDVHLIFLG